MISISREKLRNIRIRTISPRISALVRVRATGIEALREVVHAVGEGHDGRECEQARCMR